MTRHAELLASAVAGEHFRIFHDAERVIADPVVRNRGTVGGSIGQADPSEDLSAVFAAVRATVVIRGTAAARTVPAREFHVGPYETVVGAAEMITEIRVPIRPGGGSAYRKVERRAGDWAVAAAGACVWLDGDTVAEVGIGLTAVGAEHFCAPAAEDALRGQPVTDERSLRPAGAGRRAVQPEHRPARPGRVQAPPRRRADQAALRPPSPTGARRCRMNVTVTVNGEPASADVEPRLLLVHLLRDEFGLTGTHWGCDTSNCGACVVLLDGEPVKSCTVLGVMADGHAVDTVEGLAGADGLDPVQQGFMECHGLQCGFCTPG